MTLDQFIVEQRELLSKFERHYRCEAAKRPDEYPLEMEAGEWDEQIQCFSD